MTTPDTSPEPVPRVETTPEPEPAPAGADAASAATVPAGETIVARPEKRRRRKLALFFLLFGALSLFLLIGGTYLLTRKPISDLPIIPEISGEKVPHYLFSIYGVTQPMGVAVSPSGDRVYVTESEGERVVRVYDGKGKPVGTLKPPKSAGAAHIPVYVTLDPETGDVYVSDRLTMAIYVYSRDGVYRRTFQPKGDLAATWEPLGLAFDSQANLYVSDVSAPFHRLLVLGRDGVLKRTIGSAGEFSFPNGIAVDAAGNLYVTDSNNGRLVVLDPTGNLIGSIRRGTGQGDLGLPRGVAIDDSGRLYVVDTTAHGVQLYRISDRKARAPRFIGAFGEEGTLDGLFEYPNGVAADTRARVYVTDRVNDRVQVWSY